MSHFDELSFFTKAGYGHLGPVIIRQIKIINPPLSLPQKNILFNEALLDYQEYAPINVLIQVASVKFQLKDCAGANTLYDQALAKDPNCLSADALAHAAWVKLQLKDYAGANTLYDEALAKDRTSLILSISDVLWIQVQLKDNVENQAVYEKLLDKDSHIGNLEILLNELNYIKNNPNAS